MANVPADCETGRVYLHGIGLLVDLDHDQFYRDDEFVADIRDWHKGVAREVGGRMLRTVEKPSYYKDLTGLCMAEKCDGRSLTFISYRPDPFGPRFEGRTQVHEEAHALFSFGRPDILNDYMKRNGVCGFEVFDYGEETTVRMVETFFANAKMGISKEEMLPHAKKWKWIIRWLEEIGYVFT